MLVKVKQYATLEDAEIGQNNIYLWLKNLYPEMTATRWADPLVYDGNIYITLEDRVLECPECIGFIEIEITQE